MGTGREINALHAGIGYVSHGDDTILMPTRRGVRRCPQTGVRDHVPRDGEENEGTSMSGAISAQTISPISESTDV